MVSRTILRTLSLFRLRRGRARCSTHGPSCALARRTWDLRGENVPAASATVSAATFSAAMVMTELRCSGCTVRDTPPPTNAAAAEGMPKRMATIVVCVWMRSKASRDAYCAGVIFSHALAFYFYNPILR